MEIKDGKLAVYVKNRKAWRKWLLKNAEKETSVWLIIYHKKSLTPGVTLIEATEEALCFGWIDSLCKSRDKESYYLTFTPRKKTSRWSKPNIERAERMISEGLMMPQGQKAIDIAKASGKWDNTASPAYPFSISKLLKSLYTSII
jgi:uncharacterized protein YdeI (YjbR/CyaY-like superfamily)